MLKKLGNILLKKGKEYAKGAFTGALSKFVFFIIAMVIIINIIVKAYEYGVARYECHATWQESGIDYKYTFRGGCALKIGKGWIPAKNYRVN